MRSITSATKPKRVLLLQVFVVIALATVVIGTVSGLRAAPPGMPTLEIALGLARPALGFALLLVLALALQRVLPRADVLAPLAAAICWIPWICTAIADWNKPLPEQVQSLMFSGVSRAETLPIKVGVHAFFGWLVISLFIHPRTRAYLANRPLSSSDPPDEV